MTKGAVAATAPIRVEVEQGKAYFWCTCGQSAKQPFCDGSHSSAQAALTQQCPIGSQTNL
ncbi:CDGSH iron-sulfur domain-containing protein [Oceaniradius stylonematis]|uniref:CDGSH iron-sulfur domain-containing protein n=1 Tax=Oceaniradius stylonematis TaxID=2184161 RepID=A0A3A8AD80_9HYPH|nr:CDGSH iron-sulfur domain-containing protein [Oceaniradius stylonematis]RKF06979.1 CDGSH iron-sulfur domain-containing protein [Oceaniradius stylonematis]